MPRMVYSNRFIAEAALVYSDAVLADIETALRNIEAFPGIGSANVPRSIEEEFGCGIRKIAIASFDLVYECFEADDAVHVYALIHQRMAR